MKKKIKTLLVGLGKVGLDYDYNKKNLVLSHAKSIFKNKKLEFVGAVDKNFKKLIKFKKKFNISISKNLSKTIQIKKPVLIIVSVNTLNLYKTFNEIVKNKSIKYIILEKPGASNHKQLLKVYKTCRKKKIRLFINYNRTYYKKFLSQFECIKKSKNFKVFYKYNRGLYNNVSHFLNLVFHYLEEPKKILILSKEKKVSKDLKGDIEGDILLSFKNGSIYLFSSPAKNFIINEGLLLTENSKLKIDLSLCKIFKYKSKSSNLLKGHKLFLSRGSIKLPLKEFQLNTLKLKLNQKNKKNFYKKLYDANLKTIKTLDRVKDKFNKPIN